MDIFSIAVIVGIVEGVTEFLPVSSTGHMILVGNLLGFSGNLATVFEVFIQLGAILSIIFIYKDRFRYFFTADGWDRNKGLSVWHIAAGIVPVMGAGYLLHGYIKTYLFSPFTVIIGLVLGAFLMIFAEWKNGSRNDELLQDIDRLSIKQAVKIGLYQLLALWPGFSRSGSTMAGAMLSGVSRNVAAQYTFLIAVPLMFVACFYDLLKNWDLLSAGDIQVIAVGFVVSFITAYISVLWFLKFLKRYSLSVFAVYRIILAVISFFYFSRLIA